MCFLVIWQGLEEIFNLVSKGGWALLLVCLFAPFDQYLGAEAWRRLFPQNGRPTPIDTLLASWAGSAVNTLAPVASIGGELVKARILILWSYSSQDAVSSIIVDKTVQAISVLFWALIGITLLGLVAKNQELVPIAFGGALVLALGVSGFIWVQIKGGFGLIARLVGRTSVGKKWKNIIKNADNVDQATRAIYGRPMSIIFSVSLRLISRFILVGEVLLVMYLMGHPIALMEAVLLKGIVVGIRGVGFAIPGSYGIQEGSYMAVGALIGFSPELMLTVSLATRIREILPCIPFLFFWQNVEGQTLSNRDKNN